jgi:hypothetical protein
MNDSTRRWRKDRMQVGGRDERTRRVLLLQLTCLAVGGLEKKIQGTVSLVALSAVPFSNPWTRWFFYPTIVTKGCLSKALSFHWDV